MARSVRIAISLAARFSWQRIASGYGEVVDGVLHDVAPR